MTPPPAQNADQKPAGIAGKGAVAAAAAVLAAMVAAIVPTSFWENASASYGLAELVPAAAPPLGNTARMLIVLLSGLVGGSAVLAFWSERPKWGMPSPVADAIRSVAKGMPENTKPEISNMNNQNKSGILDKLRNLRFGKPDTGADAAKGPTYRRADLHPDAPLRSPIMASRDFQNVRDDAADAPKPAELKAKAAPEIETPFDQPGAGIARGEQAAFQTPKVPPVAPQAAVTRPPEPKAAPAPATPPPAAPKAEAPESAEDPFAGLTLDQLVDRLSSAIDQRSSHEPSQDSVAERSAKLNARADEMDDALKAALATLQELNVRRA
jgi:hypothetical protein